MNNIEKIINEAWENKDQVNPNSDQSLKDIINQESVIQIVVSLGLQKRLMVNGKLTNILKKLLC